MELKNGNAHNKFNDIKIRYIKNLLIAVILITHSSINYADALSIHAGNELSIASASDANVKEHEVDYEYEDAAWLIPAQIKPRYAKLILNSACFIRAIASALHAETAATYFCLYKTNSCTFNDHFEENLHPFSSFFHKKKDELYFMHYRLTHAHIVKALIDAARRGVRVHVLIDSSGFFPNG